MKKTKFRSDGDDGDNPQQMSFKDKLMEDHLLVEEDFVGKDEDLDFDSGDVAVETDGTLPSISFSHEFRIVDDEQFALTQGPWKIWSPQFDSSNGKIDYIVAWLRLVGMPLHYYHKRILRFFGQVIGNVLKIDYNTESASKGKFARISVEINLNKLLVSVLESMGQSGHEC
ncbi:hypothetical protein AB3S75_031104 [Citrus x aurantiifolia]